MKDNMAEDEWYPMKWFGPRWDSPLHDSNPEVKVPLGQTCHRCGKPIKDGDSGLVTGKAEAVWHRACYDAAYAEAKKKQQTKPKTDR